MRIVVYLHILYGLTIFDINLHKRSAFLRNNETGKFCLQHVKVTGRLR